MGGVNTISYPSQPTCASSPRQTAEASRPEGVDYGGIDNVVATAPAGLKQVVLVCSSAVPQALHPHNAWSDLLIWRLKGEERLRRSGLPYTIVRPTGMRDDPGGTVAIGFAQGDTFAFGYVICRDDAAAVCVAAAA